LVPSGGTLLQGIAVGMMLACRLSAVLIIVPFLAWLAWRCPRRAIAISALAALAFLPFAWIYSTIYGNFLGPSSAQMHPAFWSLFPAEQVAGVLVSPGRGLFVYQPWLLLAAGCFLPWPVRDPQGDTRALLPAGWKWMCLAAFVLQLGLVSSWQCWWGGHCWGSRLMAETVPLMALLCVAPIAQLCRLRGGKSCLVCLAALAFLLHAVAVFGDGTLWDTLVSTNQHPEMYWNWAHAPFLYPLLKH
jgi:hypothetical protein